VKVEDNSPLIGSDMEEEDDETEEDETAWETEDETADETEDELEDETTDETEDELEDETEGNEEKFEVDEEETQVEEGIDEERKRAYVKLIQKYLDAYKNSISVSDNKSIEDLNSDNNGGEEELIKPTRDDESFKGQEIREAQPNPTYFIDAFFEDTEIDIGMTRIKINTCHPTSMISKQLANFLKPQCFKSEQPKMAYVKMSIRSPHWQGNFTTEWEFKNAVTQCWIVL
jgi:hypothetical protein